jgi:hypothetical protein
MWIAMRASPCLIPGMEKSLFALCSLCVSLLAVSCAPPTPAARIAARPVAFDKLSDNHKELVKRGEIARGMDMSAVALAWGEPSSRIEGVKGKQRTERWEYNSSSPVVTNTFYGGYGSGYYGPYGYSGMGVGFGPEVVYIPYRKSTVWFIGGKVDEWERLK